MNKNNRNMKRQQRFIKVVSRRMAKAGFECKMMDNHFIVIKDGKPFEVEMWNTPGWGRRRVHFNLSFAFEEMDKVKPEGLMWLTSECNNHSDYTVTRYMRDHFTCCVETTVHSSKEFVREFAFATKQLGLTYQNLAANYSSIKEKFVEQSVRRPVGFLADRYMAEEEKNEACKLVAQTYTTFADEKQINTNTMKQQKIETIADAMTKTESNCDAKLKKEARIFSQMDAEAQQEEKGIEAYLQNYEDREEIIKVLKTKLGLKKVEGFYGDIAIVSDSRYRMGVVTLDGEIIVPFGKYGWIGSFREDGTAPVRDGKRSSSRKDAKWGAINRHGEEVVPLHYKKKNKNNDNTMNENDCFNIDECFDYEGNFDYERLEDAIMDGEYVPEDW